MNHNVGDRSLTIFRTSDGIPPGTIREVNWLGRLHPRIPEFLVPRESACAGFWNSLKVQFMRVKFSPSRNPFGLFRTATATRPRVPGRPLGASVLLHCSFILVV